jgi:hypothetical protein
MESRKRRMRRMRRRRRAKGRLDKHLLVDLATDCKGKVDAGEWSA